MKPDRGRWQEFINLGTVFFLGCLVLVSVLFYETFQMKAVSTYLLPRILSLFCMVAITTALLLDFFKVTSHQPERASRKEDANGLKVFYVIAFVTAYFLLIPMFGFTLTTCAAIIFFAYISGYKNKKITLPLAIAMPLIFHFLFVSLLQVKLSEGIMDKLLSF